MMIWFLLSIPIGFGIALIIIEWIIMAEILPPGILSCIGGIIIFVTILVGYRHYINGNNHEIFSSVYNFYRSVEKYIEWYDSDHAPRFIKEQKQFLDELEEYIKINNKKFSLKIIKKVNHLKTILNEIAKNLWINSQRSDQTKRYETWKNIKFNVMENKVKPLYDQLKKDLIT